MSQQTGLLQYFNELNSYKIMTRFAEPMVTEDGGKEERCEKEDVIRE